ncbi:SsgA family sporulation/cell division regulator [Streptomyces lincolnensis]|uniref:SsgA family sporulation/cell division regulator n=1 Tax=Streptomyces lincolnensis TaxID=1915 RepID=UPI0037CCF674
MDIALEQPVRARLITAERQEVPVAATFRYVRADPLAVHLDFPPEAALDGEEATWTFGRALLAEGLDAPAGSGDVRLWPCDRSATVLELHSPYGLALLRFDTFALRRFLLRTYAVVGAGKEDVGADVERGLSTLFGTV